jgi:hypothetical protein
MPDLHKALGDIGSIRRQVARTTEFRGYGPATVAATGLFAIVAATLQSVWLPDPARALPLYMALWISTAILSASLAGTQMFARTRRIHSGMADEMIYLAFEQFLPALVAGALITFVLFHVAPAESWVIPGLWQVIFSLGIFSSCRFLPRPMFAAGFWYLLTGLITLSLGDARAFSPWSMGVSFGVGQIMVAAVLFFNRPEAEDETENQY